MDVLERFAAGEIRALSRVISTIEDTLPGHRELLGVLYKKAGRAVKSAVVPTKPKAK